MNAEADHLEERIGKLEKWVGELDIVVGKLRDRLDRMEAQVRGESQLKRLLRN